MFTVCRIECVLNMSSLTTIEPGFSPAHSLLHGHPVFSRDTLTCLCSFLCSYSRCGEIFCHKCTSSSIYLPGLFRNVRVCDQCYRDYQSEGVTRQQPQPSVQSDASSQAIGQPIGPQQRVASTPNLAQLQPAVSSSSASASSASSVVSQARNSRVGLGLGINTTTTGTTATTKAPNQIK